MLDIDTLLDSKDVYQTEVPEAGYSFVWRLLTLREYRFFMALRHAGVVAELDLYIRVLQRCLIGSHLSPKTPAGILAGIGNLIMYLSGDCDSTTARADIENARAIYPAASLQEHMKRVIFTAFPTYTVEIADEWTRNELFSKFVMSEHLLHSRGEYEFFDVETIGAQDIGAQGMEGVVSEDDTITGLPDNWESGGGEGEALGSGWTENDMIERDYEEEKNRLAANQARKLDAIRKSRRG